MPKRESDKNLKSWKLDMFFNKFLIKKIPKSLFSLNYRSLFKAQLMEKMFAFLPMGKLVLERLTRCWGPQMHLESFPERLKGWAKLSETTAA